MSTETMLEDRDCPKHGRAYHRRSGFTFLLQREAFVAPIWSCTVCLEEGGEDWHHVTFEYDGSLERADPSRVTFSIAEGDSMVTRDSSGNELRRTPLIEIEVSDDTDEGEEEQR